jgi:3-isopropylmalate dehydrogenase
MTEQKAMRIAVVPGDGIGVETTREAVKVLEALAARGEIAIALTHFPWSADHYLSTGVSMPEGGFEMLSRDFDAILVGAFGDPRIPDMRHARDVLLGMRFRMDLFVNYRPVKCLNDRLSPLKKWGAKDIDFVVFRENTEGSYVGIGGTFKPGSPDEFALEQDIATRKGVERICRYAFDFARRFEKPKKEGRRPRVLMSDKHNVHRFAGELWNTVFFEVAREYPDCDASHMFVDALTMQMVKNPGQLDVVVTNNMFGDIVTDLGAILQGGLGIAASGNIHPGRTSMFEPIHGSAPYMAGRNVADPIGSVLTVQMMLEHLGYPGPAAKVERAVVEAIAAGETTKDLGGSLGTDAAGDAIVKRL